MKKMKLVELKALDTLAARIAKKRERIEAQLKAEKEMAKWYDQVLKESGYKRAKDFIKAAMSHFGIRTVTIGGARRGPGRPPKDATAKAVKATSKPAAKRKRVKVTPEVRDEIKAALTKGTAKNAVAKKYAISYAVVKKIETGGYDKL